MFNHPLNIYVIHLAALSCFCCNGLVFGIYKDYFSESFLMPRLSSSANFGPLWKYKAEALAQLHSVYQMRSIMASAETGIC